MFGTWCRLLRVIYFIKIVLQFQATDLTTNLDGYYPFSGNANDTSGNGRHGVVYSATLVSDRLGRPNSAFEFNGVSSYISIPGQSSYFFDSNFSLCFGVKV
jgi:hypothetical protein